MKRILKKILDFFKITGLILLGLFVMLGYFFKWLFTNMLVYIRDVKLLNKFCRGLFIVFKIIYAPIYYIIYVVSIILRFAICICYLLLLRPRRAWYSFKLILK